ncbi:MAG TPA: RNA 2',3'-cyclic phosphodiesterase [Desulfomicrobiaceae bacterium]|nr:RNA 2',3'-cyclic phosphodiesterase [Desulfomicrobiaceae bacterium]
MSRLFLGIALPGIYGEMLGRLRSKWAGSPGFGLRWSRPENWHLTLVFFGTLDRGAEEQMTYALERVRFTQFSLHGGGVGFFPPGGRPRVVWVGVQGELDRLSALKDGIDAALAATGWKCDPRPFVPHLTLARIRNGAGLPRDRLREDVHRMEWPSFTVDSFVLWKSELHPHGPRYTVRKVFSAT